MSLDPDSRCATYCLAALPQCGFTRGANQARVRYHRPLEKALFPGMWRINIAVCLAELLLEQQSLQTPANFHFTAVASNSS